MSGFDVQIEQSKKQVAEAQNKIAALSAQIEAARQKMSTGADITIDIENATLNDVHAHTDLMDANIAELIVGLDKVTSGFSKDFNALREKTGWEKFIGIFSSNRADAMREERMRAATIEEKLKDLIGKSNIIVSMLSTQLDTLKVHRERVENNLGVTLSEREQAVDALENIKVALADMDPKIIELENKISMETDAKARTKLESQLAKLNSEHNELAQQEQVQLAKSQTLERYIEKGKSWVDSLQNQAATQMVLINKLETDTKNRVVLYDALTKSLKTAQQQDVAHKINEIGVATDQEAQVSMSAIGAASNNRVADMLEAHDDHILFARKVLEEKAKADERFARRFEKILDKHEKNAYEASGGAGGGGAAG